MDDSDSKKLKTVKKVHQFVVIKEDGKSHIESNTTTEQVLVHSENIRTFTPVEEPKKKSIFEMSDEEKIELLKKGIRYGLMLLPILHCIVAFRR